MVFSPNGAEATGVLLAGGRGERLGEDKLLAEVGGLPLGQRVLEALAPCVARLAVSVDAPERAARARRLAVPAGHAEIGIVVDARPGEGPLAGLAAALAAAGTEAVFVAACDYPFLTAADVRALLAALPGRAAALPEIGGRLHPLCGAYARSALPRLEAFLAAGGRAATEFAFSLDPRVLAEADFAGPGAAGRFLNVNSLADLAAARAR